MSEEEEIIPDFNPDSPLLRYMRQLAIEHSGDQDLWERISAFEFATLMYFRGRPSITAAEWITAGRAMMERACYLRGEPLTADPTLEEVMRLREIELAMYRPMESGVVH